MDRYLEKTPKLLKQQDLHLLGVTSMFIASKYEDVTPIFLTTMVKKVGHNRLQDKEILSLEREILTVLKFKLSSCPTNLEYLEAYLASPYFSKHA
jgi:hypothetical protein